MCSVFGQDAREASSYECILFASQAANSLVKNMQRGAAPALATYPRVPGWGCLLHGAKRPRLARVRRRASPQ